MGNILYIITVILVAVWLVGFLGLGSGAFIHIFLIVAAIAALLGLQEEKNSFTE